MVCHSGIGLIPVVDGAVRRFSAGGLFNGLLLLLDDETHTYWDHITGDAVYGMNVEERLESFPIQILSVSEALTRHPDLTVSLSETRLAGTFMNWWIGDTYGEGTFPPGFRGTMSAPDERLPELTSGLGVLIDGQATFFPRDSVTEAIEVEISGQRVVIDGSEQFLAATFGDDESARPQQLLTRWYGFAYTYPNCSIYRPSEHHAVLVDAASVTQ